MGNFTLYHTNTIDRAILSGGSWQPKLPLDNLRKQRISQKARSVNTTAASTQFRVQLAEPVTLRGIQIISTNLSSGSSYRIRWYTDATFTTEIDNTNFIAVGSQINWSNPNNWLAWEDANFWLGAATFHDPNHLGRDIRHTFGTPITAQFLVIEFNDPGNAKGYVEAGYLYIGSVFVPSINVSPEPSFTRVSLTTVQTALGGSEYFQRRASRKRLSVAWPMLSTNEAIGDLDTIVEIHDQDQPVYVDLDPDDLTVVGEKTAFLARITTMPEIQRVLAFLDDDLGRSTLGFEFTQII